MSNSTILKKFNNMQHQSHYSMFNLLVSALKLFTFRAKILSQESTRQLSRNNVDSHEPPLPSVQTLYMQMLLHLNEISRLHTILAGLFTWILLAEYIVFSGTFTSLHNSKAVKDAVNTDESAKVLVNTVQNVSLL